ncbi:efflux RND transporter periplasmic adaptor subunit [Afipia felis]|uniref:Cation efflux system protein CzcB n=2 Tax=Afipia felis TaxID=1035 RepID=A0A380W9A8_AFIFE|nr:efflux RND transporter periplasmic adaptor subunit [Afipia felis]EKS28757.1 efflux transporter, RND family, MFP subunit [Afipia felis ATCC 53690]SUU77465.1 Cation efflux system protein CzcB [Afipia felis]SUU85531.1 Cation efflux system protein CzcB [Afipia felis]
MARIGRKRALFGACAVLVAGVAIYGGSYLLAPTPQLSDISSSAVRDPTRYKPTDVEWASLTVAPAMQKVFRAEHVTEGKISIDEDRSTQVFSPYTGRVTKLLVRAGEHVEQGQPLFLLEATDTVQAQNDFIAALTATNKARSALDLAQTQGKRAKELFEGKAVPLKDYQSAQAAEIQADNDMRSAQTALEAARNRLKILGLNDDAIASFQNKGRINPEMTVVAPIAGTVVQRKAGPGQYINAGATDPVFVIGDLSTVWLVGYVREADADDVAVGQDVSFTVLASPGRSRTARINYVATAIDPTTRRLTIRATIDNSDASLKPEMFANVTIFSPGDHPAVAVPKQALIYEADNVRLWIAHENKTIELRPVKVGLSSGNLVEVTENLRPGEQVVVKGGLFIDRAASGS